MSKKRNLATPSNRRRHVRGSIYNSNGKPAVGLTVIARSGDPDHASRILGNATTTTHGDYVVEYPNIAARSTEHVDLFLIVFAEAAKLVKLATSRVIRNAPAEALLDVVLPAPQPEYTDYLARLQPRLAKRSLESLDAAAIKALSHKRAISQRSLSLLAASARISAEAGVSEPVIYGLLRTGSPASLEQILATSDTQIRQQLKKAQDSGIIPTQDQAALDGDVRKIQILRTRSRPLTKLASTMGIKAANPIFTALARKKITTLDDVRRTGGLATVKNLGVAGDDPALVKLDAHARLMSLQPDVAANSKLIDKGYTSLAAVARATPAEISKALGQKGNDPVGGELHTIATVHSGFLHNLGVGSRVNSARPPSIPMDNVITQECDCKDCAAAVSPGAYLADLMEYAIMHLRFNGAPIDLHFFTNHFHQPFADLPSNCDAQSIEVRQVRICIEVLRSALGARPLSPAARETALKAAEQEYLLAAYEQLLFELGTNYMEIRLSRVMTADDADALASRIGVPTSALPSLLLDPDATPAQLTEANLENLFGLIDTTQPPLHIPLVSQLQRWRLATLRKIWQKEDWPADDYSDQIRPIVDPDLIGPDDFRDPVSKANAASPDRAFDIWVRRRGWADSLLQSLRSVTPRQAGTVSGPDFAGAVAAMSSVAYKGHALFWLTTPQTDPNTVLAKIANELDQMTADTAAAVTFALYNTYQLSLDAARRLIELWKQDTAFWNDPQRAPALEDGDWQEVYSILYRVQKNDLAPAWVGEEAASVVARSPGEIRKVWGQDADAGQVLLGPREFIVPLKNPIERDWPPIRSNGIPLIDPELIKLEELPDLFNLPIPGGAARKFWIQRDGVLATERTKMLGKLNGAGGIESAFVEAFGAAPTGYASWSNNFQQLSQDLLENDQTKVAAATTTIQNTLFLTMDGFNRITDVMTQLSGPAGSPLPDQTRLAEVAALLTSSWKQRTLYSSILPPGWYEEETAAATGVPPWLCARLALTKWRATLDERMQWTRILARRSQAAIIDPDNLVSTGYLKTPGQGVAWAIWNQRQQALAAQQQRYSSSLSGVNRTASALDALADSEIGAGVMTELSADRLAGMDVSGRLTQLSLSPDALDELLNVRSLLKSTPPANVLEQEWSAVCSILTQLWKQRQWADWQLEERTQGITLSQDFFQALPVDLSRFPPPPPPALDPWRGSPDTLLNWQTTLQSRLDSESSVLNSLASAVSDVEKQMLPRLRDALVAAAIAPGGISVTTTRELGDQLCISTEYGGCDMTTRVGQAIETFQIILWGVRTGLLAAAYPGLTLAAPDFDEEWTWIGTYGNWRSAMFVMLYPENIALPSLRPIQTPAFRTLVNTLRNIPRLTAAKAREVAETYATYVRDIFTLEIKATVTCATHTARGDQTLTYLFATGISGMVYWTVSDPTNPQYPYQPWDTVPGIDSEDVVVTIIGADSYRLQNGKRYLYLFLQVTTIDSEEVAFNRYDLLNPTWEQSLSSLKPPEDAGQFSAVLRQRGADERESPLILLKAPGQIFYERALDAAGRDWAEGDWVPMDRVWERWTADTSTPPLASNLLAGGRFFVATQYHGWQLSLRIIAPGKNGKIHGFLKQGLSGLVQDSVPKRLPGDVPFWNGGITGVVCDIPSTTEPSLGNTPHIVLLAVADDGGVYTTQWEPLGTWPSWTRIGSNTDVALTNSVVTVVLRAPTIIEAFFLGAQGLFKTSWHKAFSVDNPISGVPFEIPAGWSPPTLIRSSTLNFHNSEVAILAMTPSNLSFFAMTEDDAPDGFVTIFDWMDPNSDLWKGSADAGDTDPETQGFLGQPAPSAPPNFDDISVEAPFTAVRRSDKVVSLLVPRKSGGLWTAKVEIAITTNGNQSWYQLLVSPSWDDWEQIGDRTRWFSPTTHVTACLDADHTLAFAIDQNGIVQSSWQQDGSNDGNWYGWAAVQPTSSPKFVSDAYVAAVIWPESNGQLALFSVEENGILYWIESSKTSLPQRVDESYKYKGILPSLPPGVSAAQIVITDQLSDADRAARPVGARSDSEWAKSFYDANAYATKATLIYLEELLYFVPVHLALQLQTSGVYIEALDWLSEVYDYRLPSGAQLTGLPAEALGTTSGYQRNLQTWLLDPLNPHNIAETRHGAYTRFTLLAIINCLLAYADSEYTADTSETVPMARELYERALALVNSPDLVQISGTCAQMIGELQISVDDPHWAWVPLYSTAALRNISDATLLKTTVSEVRTIVKSNKKPKQWAPNLLQLLAKVSATQAKLVPFGTRITNAIARLPRLESAALAKAEIAGALDDHSATIERVLGLGLELHLPSGSFWRSSVVFNFCVPPNPLLQAIELRAELNLYKINNCRNIAGVERDLDPYAAPTDTSTGMPTIGAGGQLVVPSLVPAPATPYRYSALIDRAKQFAQQAVQMEAAFLSALEKADKEAYDLMNAKADLRLAQSGVHLQDLQVQQAQDGVDLAELQRERASIQSKTYDQWISAGLSPDQQAVLSWYDWLDGFQIAAAAFAGAASVITGSIATGAVPIVGGYLTAAFEAAVTGQTLSSQLAINAQTQINKLSVMISFEQRMQDLTLQKALADEDFRIGGQQVQIANDQVRVAQQQHMIEQMKADHAQEVVDFLTNKFTNLELYDFMSSVLQGVYSFFLQHGTGLAQQAAAQLAFERQETLPSIIQADYLQPPQDVTSAAAQSTPAQSTAAPDRRGLTGSARLLQDIYQLDQYAFEKNSRKQQLTKTISLRELDPLAFQQFLETGVLPFTLPMELFDWDFPGHYLRLFTKIRTTLIALIPPSQGIRASLSSSGISRVVVSNHGLFQTQILRRPPETLALSAPYNSTGLFDLQQPTDMTLPFEDLGVATSFQFSLPKAANPIDYSSIGDVLVTMDYTALDSFDYRQQVIQLLNARLNRSADRAYSFRGEFADAWYDLNNPDQSATPMSVSLKTNTEDFPPNMKSLKIAQVALYFARSAASKLEITSVDLRLEPTDGGSLGGVCATVNGLISTSGANGGAWLSLVDANPAGTWQLTLPNTADMRSRFENEEITDILLVVTFTGSLPPWPT